MPSKGHQDTLLLLLSCPVSNSSLCCPNWPGTHSIFKCLHTHKLTSCQEEFHFTEYPNQQGACRIKCQLVLLCFAFTTLENMFKDVVTQPAWSHPSDQTAKPQGVLPIPQNVPFKVVFSKSQCAGKATGRLYFKLNPVCKIKFCFSLTVKSTLINIKEKSTSKHKQRAGHSVCSLTYHLISTF